WYYTFGVNCSHKFTRSHAHLFHFVKDSENFTFRSEDLDNRVPSARELVYNDKRANPQGRLPDDTWLIRPSDAVGEMVSDDDTTWHYSNIKPDEDEDRTYVLRPQDLGESFSPLEDTWYFPRVAGTFKERAGFHGCQMPEQLLGRIIRTCSNEEDIVLDPFSGSATTLAVAKKLGRRFTGYDVSTDYVEYGLKRLSTIEPGDPLDGSQEPTKSAPPTNRQQRRLEFSGRSGSTEPSTNANTTSIVSAKIDHITRCGIVEAFRTTHDGFSADRVVADPELNFEFVRMCSRLGLPGNAQQWNTLLFRFRKAGELSFIPTSRRTDISWEDSDEYMFASEIAWQYMIDTGQARSLDDILCDPQLSLRFHETACMFAPNHSKLAYRWAALRLRKQATIARGRSEELRVPTLREMVHSTDDDIARVPAEPGLYIVMSKSKNKKLYAGETLNLREQLELFNARSVEWSQFSAMPYVKAMPLVDQSGAAKLAWQSCLVKKFKPQFNYSKLRTA
ncbi:MAG: hypothetical protein HQ518_13245, partial [Rhodopirellula sp.]|nr:hypothetical protein [Rhodopirellula sp.]